MYIPGKIYELTHFHTVFDLVRVEQEEKWYTPTVFLKVRVYVMDGLYIPPFTNLCARNAVKTQNFRVYRNKSIYIPGK